MVVATSVLAMLLTLVAIPFYNGQGHRTAEKNGVGLRDVSDASVMAGTFLLHCNCSIVKL